MTLLRAAWVIARRDYVATVFSRSFVIFLLAPLLPILFAGMFGAAGGDRAPAAPPPLMVQGDPATIGRLETAQARIAARLGPGWLPPIVAGAAHPGSAVLSGGLDRPALAGPKPAVDMLAGPVGLLIDEARALRGGALPPVRLALHPAPAVPPDDGDDRRMLAHLAQLVAFVLTMILAGMLMFNLVEEKSSKVIELLAAAVPVDAIFAGKLVGMLAVSLSAIAAWGGAAGLLGAALLHHGALAAPAVGWVPFALLAVGYWVLLYLLTGALYLGVGAQAGSVREIQSLSLPLTFAQLAFFGLGSAAAADPGGLAGRIAYLLPWSTSYAMLARAATRPGIALHLVAMGWQLVALAVVVRLAGRLFRRTVLNTGQAGSVWGRLLRAVRRPG